MRSSEAMSLCGLCAALSAGCGPEPFLDGQLVAADYWSEEPSILSGGYGFDGIIGVDRIDEATVRAVGGSWNGSLTCTNGEDPADGQRTSVTTANTVGVFYRGDGEIEQDDGLPVVFSWPVATETIGPGDFLMTLNTGETVVPDVAGMVPNWELNERNVVVVFGEFGNRLPSTEEGARFVVRTEVVDDTIDGTPLLLVGPGGEERSAVGLSWETTSSPYDAGPTLVGAKLTRVDGPPRGEGAPRANFIGVTPNDELSLYGDADFRLRMLTTGGWSPDGFSPLHPDRFSSHFRLHAIGEDGKTVFIESPQTDYRVQGGTLRVLGLSDLGRPLDPDAGVYYDDCYTEDRDNYVDIILVGDEAAARSLTFLEVPAADGYLPLYNPGGPGPAPFEGITYTAPSLPDLEPILIALDDPMRVDRD